MARIAWTHAALADLDRLESFLWQASPVSAERAITAILDATELLQQFPEAGRPSADLDPDHRELLLPFGNSGYVVGYGVYRGTVEILSVRHMREDDAPSPQP